MRLLFLPLTPFAWHRLKAAPVQQAAVATEAVATEAAVVADAAVAEVLSLLAEVSSAPAVNLPLGDAVWLLARVSAGL